MRWLAADLSQRQSKIERIIVFPVPVHGQCRLTSVQQISRTSPLVVPV
jgi:hypothetical protein